MLYRSQRSLKLAKDWSYSRSSWYPAAYVIRHQFRENIGESDPRKIDFLVRGAEDILAYMIHTEPYHGMCTLPPHFLISLQHPMLLVGQSIKEIHQLPLRFG